ncbi:hypothetical protein KG088_05380 [Halomonas sp. TRM85114]|uniref:hypothetical protein n=1 Tax=Halomonas jincaotanensis TaxID=2810616 RepID=UPI001BD4CE5C|nr:hypothetical protein [Halomonas jincaotanensis]MBS9403054.1 hypothetical protein [Halomonas jincaotanensis]
MSPDPQRLQYLEAMGVTAWVARYRLPNARPTPACEWEIPAPVATEPPSERLHALLDEAARPPSPPSSSTPEVTRPERHLRPVARGKARALLGEPPDEARESTSPELQADPDTTPAPAAGEALRFIVQVACLDGRWLVMLAERAAPRAEQARLLANLLQAAGVIPEQFSHFEAYHWPQMEGLPVEAPLDEARQGLKAFLDGRRRRGWAPERVLLFGHDADLEAILALADGHCPTLALPAWQGPSLSELAASAEAKRALWPQMAGWRAAWRGDRDEVQGEAQKDNDG